MRKVIKIILIIPYFMIFGLFNFCNMVWQGFKYAWQELDKKLRINKQTKI